MKKWIAFLLAVVMCLSLCSCGGFAAQTSEAAKSCQDLIQGIGTVTLESKEAIEKAEDAFAKLTKSEKESISDSAAVLTDARKAYDTLEKQAKIDNVIALIDDVVASIDATDGLVTLESADIINAAGDAYNKLSEEDKAKVTNSSKLELAQIGLGVVLMGEEEKLKAEKEKIIQKHSSKFNIETDAVEGITWCFPKNKPQYVDTRSYLVPYIGVRDGKAWICIRYHYTDDDWVFWQGLKIVADGMKYTKTVKYSDVKRNNANGDVWEYYDEVLRIEQKMDTDEIVMLKQIANSKETIIRFQGDKYHSDYYVTKEDKAMIKDVLALYEALLP